MVEEDEASGMLRLNWRTVAIGSLLLNLAAIAGIAAVSIVKKADVLSTVALLLAVIAFVCQLIVYAIQTSQASAQLRQAESLNAGTETLLAEVRTRIEGTHQMVSLEHEELMRLVLAKSATEVVSKLPEGGGSPELDVLVREVESVTVPPPAEDRHVQPSIKFKEADSRGVGSPGFDRWTLSIERARELSLELAELGPNFNVFAINVAAYVLGTKFGEDGSIKRFSSDEALIARGLVKDGSLVGGERSVTLTQKGAEAGQLLAAPWPPPEHLSELSDDIWALRGLITESTAARLATALDLK